MAKVFDLSREDLVLRKFFDDTALQHKIATHLDPKLFREDGNPKLVELILRFQKKFNRYPSAQEMTTALPQCAEKKKLIGICNADIQAMERSFEVTMLETFFRERKTESILASAAESIFNGDFSNISDLIKDLQNSVNFNLSTDLGINVVDDAEEALRRLNESLRAIPSALRDVRAYTSNGSGYGGHYRKALSIFLGMPNVGKSIVLCNEAAFAYQKGYNVLYVTMEMSEELIWERIATNVTDIDLRDIRSSDVNEIKKLLTKSVDGPEYNPGSLTVKALPTTATVIDIENEIIELKRTKNIDIDLLVVDYIGIMKPSKRANSISQHSLYTMGKEIAEQLRDLAKSRSIAVVTASQMNREGYSSRDASMTNVAGSAGLNDTADFMITITQDEVDRAHGFFYHMILKNRFGPNNIGCMSKCDYMHMRVRSATEEELRMMSELQSNRTTNVPNFSTPANAIKGSGEAPSKSKLEAIYNKDEKVNIEEYILDNTSVSESLTEYTEDSDDPEELF
jgi:replicative DNA helicase